MRNRALRHGGIFASLVGPLLLLQCHDEIQVCSMQAASNGSTGTVCKTINDVGQSTLALRSAEPAGEHCRYGGERIDTGFDLNGNLQLDESEIDISAYICNGVPGATGADGIQRPAGPNGADGSTGPAGANGGLALVSMAAENAGSNCAQGGLAVRYGIDTNGNGTLDDEEVTGTNYVCAGATGATGPRGMPGDAGVPGATGQDGNGRDSLVDVTNFSGASGSCSSGGVQIDNRPR